MGSSVTAVVDTGLGNTAWLIDLGDNRLAVVDPERHPGRYLAHAEQHGARIAFSIETHLHADFLTGSRELAAHGATVVAPAGAELAWPHRPLTGGDSIDVGGLSLTALATPGHTPEHLAYLLADGNEPLGVFTGGSLLVGAVARTDLISPEATEPLARALWRSLHEQLLRLPDATPVYPTHGAGSFCAASDTSRRSTTIGGERRSNPLLALAGEDEFAAAVLAGFGTYPRYFRRLRDLNRAGPDILGLPQPGLPALDLVTFRRHLDDGAVLVDTREAQAWAAGHVPGALAIPLRDQFASWLGWLVERDRPLLFTVGADQDRAELVRQCHQIGHGRMVGELAGGLTAWAGAGLQVMTAALVDAAEMTGTILDVRQDAERATAHVPGTLHVELGDLTRAADELPRVDATMCGHGERAATAASLLERAGRPGVAVVIGGPEDWAAATGRPLATG